jgi:hypothetical protein
MLMKSNRKQKTAKAAVVIKVDATDLNANADNSMKQNRDAMQEQSQAEQFWAGRNLAARRSARAAA